MPTGSRRTPRAPSTVCPSAIATRSRSSSFVANPGCYVTASLLALIPLGSLGERIATVIIDAKSGVTGAGRNPEGANAVRRSRRRRAARTASTGIATSPEIVQEARAAGIDAPIVFSPHVVPLRRGILADVYLVPRAPIARDEVEALYVRFYASNPFVTVFTDKRVPHLPARRENEQRAAQGRAARRGRSTSSRRSTTSAKARRDKPCRT